MGLLLFEEYWWYINHLLRCRWTAPP